MLHVIERLAHFSSGCLGKQSQREEEEGVRPDCRTEIILQFPPDDLSAGFCLRRGGADPRSDYILSGAGLILLEVAFLYA